MEKKEPKIHENDKRTIFVKGGNTSERVTQTLKDLVMRFCQNIEVEVKTLDLCSSPNTEEKSERLLPTRLSAFYVDAFCSKDKCNDENYSVTYKFLCAFQYSLKKPNAVFFQRWVTFSC